MKRDCVMFKDGACSRLNCTICKDETAACRFYKTREMLKRQVEKIRERVPDYQSPFLEREDD